MESFQFLVETWLAILASWAKAIPLGFSFSAGIIAAFNPCGFALLPSYLSLHLSGNPGQVKQDMGQISGYLKGLYFALAVTAGFVLLFAVVGSVVATGGHFITRAVPWIAVIIGGGLVLAGVWMLLGKTLYSGFASRAAAKISDPAGSNRGVLSFFLFGVTYALASLSCTLPIFLIVVSTSLVTGGLLNGVFQFLIYALGMGVVIILLTLAIVAFKGRLMGPLHKGVRFIERGSAVVVILAGLYLIYYWLFIGGLL